MANQYLSTEITVDDPEIQVIIESSGIPDGPSIVQAIDTELGSSVWQSPGAAGSTPYVHTQASPIATWSIVHGLGYFPNVIAFDGSNVEIRGSITHLSANEISIVHGKAVDGVAYLS